MYPDHNYTWLYYVYIFGGVYDPNKIKSRFKRWLCRLYNIFLIGYCLIYFFSSELAYLDQTMNDMYVFLNAFGLFTTHWLGVAKWLVMLRCANEFDRIQKQLENEKYHYEDYKDFKPGETQFQCRKYARIFVVTFMVFGNFVPITKDINFIYGFAIKGNQVGTGNVTCLELLPFYSYIPFDIESYWMCIFGYIFQSYPVTGFVGPIISFDLTFAVITIFLCGNFINIKNAFETMRGRCLVRLGLPEDYQVLNDNENLELEREIAAEVKKLSIHLQEHIEIVVKMESLCQYVILGQALTALFALVTCLYIMSVETTFSPMLVAQVHYGVSINVQLSSYCIVGNAITEWSSNVATGIINSDWLSCTRTVKMSLMINLMRLQKPIYYTIGKFTPLTLKTFLQIVKGSYSYFTFLQKT